MDQFAVSTLGLLLASYGQIDDHNLFHDGTIFTNSATGAIWIENQVFLGAVETLMAKACFEE